MFLPLASGQRRPKRPACGFFGWHRGHAAPNLHAAPLSTLVKTLPPAATAASLPPSAEEASEVHCWAVEFARIVHVAPPSAEVKMSPPTAAAASRVPLAEDATALHCWEEEEEEGCLAS